MNDQSALTTAGVREDLRLQFSDEQSQIQDIAHKFCRDKTSIPQTRNQMADGDAFNSELWQQIVELGWPAMTIDEAYGGVGLDVSALVPIAEAMAETLTYTPLINTVLFAETLKLAGTDAQRATWLPKIAEGAIAALALSEPHGDWDLTHVDCQAARIDTGYRLSGAKCLVNDIDRADVVLISAAHDNLAQLFVLETAHIDTGRYRHETVIDETQRAFFVDLNNLELPEAAKLDPSKAGSALAQLDRLACLMLAADSCGALNGTLNLVVEYLNTRRQFGQLIGGYQALKHPTVDMLTGLDGARSHLYHAASIANDPVFAETAARMAKAYAGDALAFAADRAIQFHGGFGFTYDCDAQLYRRRGLWNEARHGDAAYQRQILAHQLL